MEFKMNAEAYLKELVPKKDWFLHYTLDLPLLKEWTLLAIFPTPSKGWSPSISTSVFNNASNDLITSKKWRTSLTKQLSRSKF